MKLDGSNERYRMIIAGILVITVLSICVAFLIGFGDNTTNDEKYFKSFNYPFNSNVEKDNFKNEGNNNIVSVAQKKKFCDVDTEVGYIDFIEEELPDWSKLPLCITQETVEGYYVLVKSVGGYKPYDGYIEFRQDRFGRKDCKEVIGYIKLNWDKVDEMSTCCYTVYNVTMDVVPDCIHIDSNYFPWDCQAPDGWFLEKKVPDTPDLNKKVDIKVVTKWKGCDDKYQHFELILTQKKNIFRSPQLPIYRQLNAIINLVCF